MANINNERIAKNTMMLYVRMFALMAVSLYTSRVILQIIGIEDYGIYNLVAGFVTFFAFISNSLTSAFQRFFNVALGCSDKQNYVEIYSTSINIMILFSIIILLVGETVGLWLVNNHINIPSNREYAAEWVFHISLITFIVSLFRTTFDASIIAHENMNFYAYISIIEVFLKLFIVWGLQIIAGDKLIAYVLLFLCVTILTTCANWLYCRYKYLECRYVPKINKKSYSELLKFSSWTLVGQSAVVVKNQGESILINKFFSVVANASLGVASQVTSAIDRFVVSFQTAFNPQIIKTYAAKEIEQYYLLLCRASKVSYYLLLILSMPILFNIDVILKCWLTIVPEQTNYFCVFIIVSHLVNALGAPFNTAILATGKIKNYQILCAVIFILGLLLSGVCLWSGLPAYIVAVVGILVQVLLLTNRILFTQKLTGFSVLYYTKKVILPISTVSVVYILLVFGTSMLSDNIIKVIALTMANLLFAAVIIYNWGLDNAERLYAKKFFRKLLHLQSQIKHNINEKE